MVKVSVEFNGPVVVRISNKCKPEIVAKSVEFITEIVLKWQVAGKVVVTFI